MSKNNFILSVKDSASKHAPEILTGIGIAGMITTTILSVKATPKALYLIDSKKMELEKEKLTTMEVVRTTWSCYIPAIITCGASVACLIGASSVNLKRNAALAAAYKISEKALTEYKTAVTETIGEKKETAVRERVAENRIKDKPVSKSEILVTGKDASLCYDVLSDRYFKSDYDAIKKAENELNSQMLRDDYISLNDLYFALGIDGTKIGDDLGWNRAKSGELLTIDIKAKIADDGRPCLVLDYSSAPQYKFNYYG